MFEIAAYLYLISYMPQLGTIFYLQAHVVSY